jgi:hypothetical protein
MVAPEATPRQSEPGGLGPPRQPGAPVKAALGRMPQTSGCQG